VGLEHKSHPPSDFLNEYHKLARLLLSALVIFDDLPFFKDLTLFNNSTLADKDNQVIIRWESCF
jgi:hypothetical protein